MTFFYVAFDEGGAYLNHVMAGALRDPVINDAEVIRYLVECAEADLPGLRLAGGAVVQPGVDTPAAREQIVASRVKPEIERRILQVASVMDQHNTKITVDLAREYLAGGLTAGQRATLEAAMPTGVTVAEFVTSATESAITIKRIKDVAGAALKAYVRDPGTPIEAVLALDATAEEWWA